MSDTDNDFNQHVATHMERIGEIAWQISPQISAAAQCIVQSLLDEGQVIACGAGKANALAQYFCTCLLSHYESDRPALPAVNVGNDATTFAAICMNNRIQETLSRQIQALGREGDTLLLLTDDGNKSSLIQSIQAAHDRNLRVIAITGKQETDLHSLLHDNDIAIGLPDLPPSTAAEIIVLILNAICAQVEEMLFGST